MVQVDFMGEQEEDLQGKDAAVLMCPAFETFLGEASNTVPSFTFLARGTSKSESTSLIEIIGQIFDSFHVYRISPF